MSNKKLNSMMNKKNILFTSLLLAFGLANADVSKEVESQIKSILPSTNINTITPVQSFGGVYEVIAGDNAFFVSTSNDTQVIVGHVINIKNMQDETQLRLDAIANNRKIDWKSLPLKNALKFGKGKPELAVFIDPDCPYCRELDKYLFTKLNKVTINYIFLPLPMHPNAMQHTSQILCSANPAQTVQEIMMKNTEVNQAITKDCQEKVNKIVESNIEFAKQNKINFTPLIITKDGTIINGFDKDKLDAYIGG